MKRILLIAAAVIGIAFLSSCKKEIISSLDGTTWTGMTFVDTDTGGGVIRDTLVFAGSTFDYSIAYWNGEDWLLKGTYTYNSPTVRMSVISPEGGPGNVTGKIEKGNRDYGMTMQVKIVWEDGRSWISRLAKK